MTETIHKLQIPELGNADWPQPVGWRILVQPATPASVSEGGIIMAEETMNAERHLNYVGLVLRLGPLCYKHPKFLNENGVGEPWVKEGDWVAYGQYAGQKIQVRDDVAVDRVKDLREELEELEDEFDALQQRFRMSVGSKEQPGLQGELEDKAVAIAEKRRDIALTEQNTTRELRLLNDDEVLSVLPNKNAIRIYI